jgi:hypothetical protein
MTAWSNGTAITLIFTDYKHEDTHSDVPPNRGTPTTWNSVAGADCFAFLLCQANAHATLDGLPRSINA